MSHYEMVVHNRDVVLEFCSKAICYIPLSGVKWAAFGAVVSASTAASAGVVYGAFRVLRVSGALILDFRERKRNRRELELEFGELLIEPEGSYAVEFDLQQLEPVPFKGTVHMRPFMEELGGYLLQDGASTYIARKCHVYDPSLRNSVEDWTYFNLNVLDTLSHASITESPVDGSQEPIQMPDLSDSFVALTSSSTGKGPFVGAVRDGDWLITARHATMPGNVLQQYLQCIYLKKGDNRCVRAYVLEAVVEKESQRITDLALFGNTGHDLIALRIRTAAEIFALLGVKTQKHWYPLASGLVKIKAAFGKAGVPYVCHGVLQKS